jgi:hypothetical protein
MRGEYTWSVRLVVFLLVAACTSPPYTIDPYPLTVDTTSQVPIVRVVAPSLGDEEMRFVIDSGSPFTLVDTGDATVVRRSVEMTLLREPVTAGGLAVPRATFPGIAALLTPVGQVGMGTPTEINGVLGGDVLSRVAVRVEAARSEVRFFPDIAGSATEHEDACDAVFSSPPLGGGLFVINGATAEFSPTRLTIGACLAPEHPICVQGCRDADPEPHPGCATCQYRGQDVLLVVATGVRPTVLTRSAYHAALRATYAEDAGPQVDEQIDAEIAALPTSSLYLPGSTTPRTVLMGSLPRLALAGNERDEHGPCREVAASRQMADRGCTGSQLDCPCPDENLACGAAPSAEVGGEVGGVMLEIAIVEDTDPLLQALREELRPLVADVDGLLGMDFLKSFVVDLDYPNDRLIFRCDDVADPRCTARPRIAGSVDEVLGRAADLKALGCFPE